MIHVPMSVSVSSVSVPMRVSAQPNVSALTGIKYEVTEYQKYDGPLEFTPSDESQIVETSERVLLSNIIINPIPSNYGKISYNGSVLTVT